MALVMAASDYLTPAEAASELRVSLGTIYSLLRAGKIRAVKVGAQYRIDKREVIVQTRQEPPGFYSYVRDGLGASDRR